MKLLSHSEYTVSGKVLGRGGFGKVVRGTYHGPVAIKMFDLHSEAIDLAILKSEVKIAR